MIRNNLRVASSVSKKILDDSLNQYRSSLNLQQILLACTPKSGSTYLSTKIENLSNWRRGSFVPAGGRRVQELEGNSIRTSLLNPKSIISQNHTRFSEHSALLINRFNLKVIFLVRNILDCAASVSDHWSNESVGGPMMYLNDSYLSEIDSNPNCTRLQLIASAVMPFYIQFYLSWINHCQALNTKYVWCTYESIFDKSSSTHVEIGNILNQLNVPHDLQEIESSVYAHDQTRFNKGRVGRGEELFKNDMKAYETIQRLLDCYPTVDFSPIYSPLFTTI